MKYFEIISHFLLGSAIWGNATYAPDHTDDMKNSTRSYGHILSFTAEEAKSFYEATGNQVANMTVDETLSLLNTSTDPKFARRLMSDTSFGVLTHDLQRHAETEKMWTNPLESALPNAPDMKMYCMYGYGKSTERAYFYSFSDTKPQPPSTASNWQSSISNMLGSETPVVSLDTNGNKNKSTGRRSDAAENSTRLSILEVTNLMHIDTSVDELSLELNAGVQDTIGDGTVPLLSLGFMCASGWRWQDDDTTTVKRYGPIYNPGKASIISREYQHDPLSIVKDMRGGPRTGDHVDILGNFELTLDVLKIASGNSHLVQDQFVSNIRDLSNNVDLKETKH